MKSIYLLLAIILLGLTTQSQNKNIPENPSPIIYIYDASGSMWGQMEGKTKMEIASNVLANSLDNFTENQKIGLIAYGHRKKGDCLDVEMLVPLNNTSKQEVVSKIKQIKPLGKTPLAYSAKIVIDELRTSKKKATIVLITDGIESCDGNICDIVRNAKAEGIDFKLHIVGFGLKKGETKQLECAANAGDGIYYDATNTTGLGDALSQVTVQTIDKPKGNLGVFVLKDGKALDADVQAYKSGTNNKVDFGRTYKDTTYLYLPKGTYDLKVWQHSINVITPVTIKGVKTLEDQTTYKTVNLDGSKINVLVKNNGTLWDSNITINNQKGQRVFGGRSYAKPKVFDLDAGNYNIIVEARNVYGLENKYTLENVNVGNGEIVDASHNFKTGIAILGATFKGEPFDANIKIIEPNSKKTIYAFRTRKRNLELMINPGKYQVTFTEPGVYDNSAMSTTFTIVVNEGVTTTYIQEVK